MRSYNVGHSGAFSGFFMVFLMGDPLAFKGVFPDHDFRDHDRILTYFTCLILNKSCIFVIYNIENIFNSVYNIDD